MADSTTNLDLISASQASKEVTANALSDAMSQAALGGRRASTTSGLTWGYYGGNVNNSGTITRVANGALTLADNTTNYVEMTAAGVVSSNTTAFTAGRTQLYTVVTSSGLVTSYSDKRAPGTGSGSGSIPTGTGFVHVTSGAQDGAAVAVDLSTAHATGVLAAGRFPALTGDVTTSAGALATTLATSGVAAATYGDGTHVGQFAVNAKGLITSAASVAITGAAPSGSAGGDLTGTYPNPTLNLATVHAWTKNQSVTFSTLTDASTVATDASLSNNFLLNTIGGNRTLGNPTNLTDGMVLNWVIKQDGTGSRTLVYGSKFKFPGGAPVLTTTAGAVDVISGVYNLTLDLIFCNIAKALA